jgi:glycosyltransferase involved in cell wall biosynthesis
MNRRVLILVNNIDELGGAQRVSHTLAQGLAQRGYDVELVGLIPKPPVHTYVDEPMYRMRTLLTEPRDPKRKAAQQQFIEQALADVLGSGVPGIVITAQVWAMEHVLRVPHAGWRMIGQYHSSYAAAREDGDLERIRIAYRDADWFTVLSDGDAERFTWAGMNNCITMVNPIHPWPHRVASHQARTLTVLGRMSWEKAPDVALQAWAELVDAYPDWSMQFIGHGPMASEIATTAVPRVSVIDATDDPIRALLETGIYVLPSLVEGLPMSLLEAMACGLPVVASNCSPGVRSLVTPEVTGLLAEPGNPHSLAGHIRRLIDDANVRERLGMQARQRAEEYRLAPVVDRWEWLITQTYR